MEIELSEDLQHYKESLVLGLTAKQFLFSALALGVGTGIVLLLYEKIGITLSCYVATPFVVPLALTGFYNYHGLTFWQFAGKMIYFSFFNRPLVYGSGTETDLYGNPSGRRTGSTAKEKGTEKREERW
ncbi:MULTISPECIES: PrgI family protein [Lachnospiraceae]|uniref:PrgI family protein n=1 Tax=Lachnospiraceae TaxID=186803 RepID=UPI001FAA7106|nr:MULTISPECIES: PrgI family protein [Lachnospiraceae]